MQNSDVMDLAVLQRRMYNLLGEVLDLTEQMGEAISRQDQVSVQMLIAMRQEPIEALEQVKKSLTSRREALAPADAARVARLMEGGAAADPSETPLVNQIAMTRRLLERTVELDRRISTRLSGKDSFYAKNE